MRDSLLISGARRCAVAPVAVATAALAALLAVTAPVAAQSPAPSPPAAPVAISDCRGGIASIELIEIAAYDVTLRDTAAVAADEVRLAIRYGRRGKTADFDLHGSFAPGTDVTKHLRRTVGGGLYSYESDRNDCTVQYVHFSDGTSWSRAARP